MMSMYLLTIGSILVKRSESMAENKMADVAKLLELELREEFKIQGLASRYRVANTGLQYYSETEDSWVTSNKLFPMLLQGKISIIKVEQPILDNIEKKYLSNIIKPFRNKVIGITKYDYSNNGEYIHIKLKRTISPVDYFIPLESIDLPIFKRGIMYKGMELRREYTLKDLGL